MVNEPGGTTARVYRDLALPLSAVLLHLIVNAFSPYEIHRDEFLYVAMGEHLRLFRMDFPPLIAMIARLEHLLFGASMWGLRLVPALCHGALVLVAMRIARRLGGGRAAITLAGFAVLLSPLTLRSGSLFQPVVLDQLVWTVGLLLLAKLCTGSNPRWWYWLGVVGGIGLLAKFSIGFFAVGVIVALLLSPRRRDFLTPHPWLAATIALVIGSPSIVGQIVLGWPVRGQMADLAATQLHRVTSASFLGEQLLYGPMAWLGVVGLVALLFAPALKRFRPVAVAALVTTGILLVLHGKAYYLGPIWPALGAAGAVWLEVAARERRTWLMPAATTVTAAFGLSVALPIGLPILPPPAMADYSRRVGVTSVTETNTGEVAELPQDFADMLGWRDFAEAVAAVWDSLPADERATAVLVATNYGRAGALDWYGPALGLPPAVCPCGSYWFWGPGTRHGDVSVVAGGDSTTLAPLFRELHSARVVENPWRVTEERRVTIWVGRGPKASLADLWPMLKGRN